jgi:hypothetical protein
MPSHNPPLAAICSAILLCVSTSSALAIPEEKLEFFEAKIRPVLVEHCYRCHGAESVAKGQLKGGLRVDTKQGLLTGGDSGPAVVPSKPDESALIDALKYDSFEMPPAGQLSPGTIADFEKWIMDGAIDPREDDSPAPLPAQIDIEAGRRHWAYHPIPTVVVTSGHSSTAIDAHIDVKWRAAELIPTRAADRRTLVRRLYIDITGLPPTPDEVEQFLEDQSPLAYERLVDRLLSSPEFGRHWGRHWLDIVRFAESVTLRGLVQQQAWRYRDYVIDSWNRDLPYDQFLREQVAGDLIAQQDPPGQTLAEKQRRHIATTFLTLTDANLEDQDKEKLRMDVVDEQLNVIGKAFLAQTLGCARCHDHKFDPIPTADYYAMAGILHNTRTLEESNVSRWRDLNLPLSKEEEAKILQKQGVASIVEKRIAVLKKSLTKKPTANGVRSADLAGIVVDDEQAEFVGAWTRSASVPIYVDRGYQHDANMAQGEKSATFSTKLPQSGEYEVRFAYTASGNRSSKAEVTVWSTDGEALHVMNQRQQPDIDGLFVSLGRYEFSKEEAAKVVVSNRNSDGVVIVDTVQFLPVAPKAATPPAVAKKPTEEEAAELARIKAEQELLAVQLKKLEAELKQMKAAVPQRPMYMGVTAWAETGDMPLHIRGNVHHHGPVVPRGFLQVATYYDVEPVPKAEEGRLQLADWLAHETNPLPARVIANRVWHWLFGTGLVRSTDNFGAAGETPSHPELLDHLARTLIDNDWSVKALIREIVVSDAYRRSSESSNAAMAVDPENRLLWRMNRKRLEAESIQDAILLAADQLDRTHGGSTLPPSLSDDYGFKYASRRRAVYWPQLRNSMPSLISAFDGPNPSLVVGNRNVSSVATQALFMMNNEWVLTQSENAARRFLAQSRTQPSSSDAVADDNPYSETPTAVRAVFERILGRPPSSAEEQATLEFLEVEQVQSDSERLDRWTQLVQSLFSTVDFRFRY